jgi:hypothetical protein
VIPDEAVEAAARLFDPIWLGISPFALLCYLLTVVLFGAGARLRMKRRKK